MAPEGSSSEEEMMRLHRIGVVDALTDCLALVVQEQLAGPALQSIVQQWLAQESTEANLQTGSQANSGSQPGSSVGAQAGPGRGLTLPGGAVATDRQAMLLRRGMREGYTACAEWAAQGLAKDVLAARILRRIFAVWPREPADYQGRYDAYLEKELQNPRASYYASSRVWRMDVDNLRTRVNCAADRSAVIGERPLQRAVKLLHRHPERLAAARTPAAYTGTGSLSANQPSQRSGGTLESGHS